jgi:hypothetical protein
MLIRRSAPVRSLFVVLCALAIPHVSLGQSNQSSWENLSSLRTGQKIEVIDTSSKKHTGTFSGVAGEAIRLNDATGEQTVQRAVVMRVNLQENRHRTRNTLIGAGIGAGAGAAIGPIGHHQGSLQNPNGTFIKPGQAAAIGAVIGAVSGAVVGALWPSHVTLYRASPH